MLRTSDLDYELPGELIATHPAPDRQSARLLVMHRAGAGAVRHQRIMDLPALLQPGDLLVVNITKVVPARFQGERCDTGGRVEGLFLEARGIGDWLVLLKSNGKLRPGQEVRLRGAGGELTLRLRERAAEAWLVEPQASEDPYRLLERVGLTPLPPYILRARKERPEESVGETDALDRAWYQTVYADEAAAGAVAAPTAGLHFTASLLAKLAQRGVGRAEVVLQVGAGTFKPIETEHVEEHPMHRERFVVSQAVMRRIVETREKGGRVIAVGTTTARALESLPALDIGKDVATETDLLITPGYEFRHLDGLLTNFHLPRSTLLAMVGALLEGGVPRLLRVYQEAIRERYRFYSYGDAMLILPGPG